MGVMQYSGILIRNKVDAMAVLDDAENANNEVWQLPNPLILLLGRFLDQFFLQKFVEDCKESAELLWSGREMVLYSNEIELFASAVYYFGSVCSFSATPGQTFGEVKQFHYLSNETVEGSSLYQRIITSLLYAGLPYLYQKKSKIWEILSDACTAFLQAENVNESTNHEPPENEKQQIVSFLSMTFYAFKNSIRSISSEVDKCLERICSFAQEIHLALFLYSGFYLEIPLRVTKTVLLTQNNSFFQVKCISSFIFINFLTFFLKAKLKSLSWLLSFRLIILFYYGTRVFLSELDDQQLSSSNLVIPSSQRSESPLSSTPEEERFSSITPTVEGKNYQCPLCLDTIHQPAVIPCGHIGCWNCFLSYATKTSMQSTDSSFISSATPLTTSASTPNALIKCPVCRYEFQSQKIRPILL